MSRKIKYKVLLGFILTLWAVLLGYKSYLYLYEKDYTGMNARSLEQIQTLVNSQDRFSFAVLGNVKNSMKIFEKRISPLLREEKVDFIILAGNAVRGGTEAGYRLLNRGLDRSGLPYILAAGVREVENSGTGRFYRHFGPLFFSMKAGNASFIFLDSTGTTSWHWQRKWLENELDGSEDTALRFVILNHSVLRPSQDQSGRTQGKLDAGDSLALRELLSRYGVTAVFSSGYAAYDRQNSKGVEYFISGRAGGLFLDDRKNPYQYLRVDVSGGLPSFNNVQVPNGKSPIAYKIETLGYFLHSLFYISFTKFLFVLGLVGLGALRVYYIIIHQENLYQDFNVDERRITSEPLRLAAFTDNYLPYIGGVPISIQRLSQGLQKRGSTVKIFAPSYGNGCREKDDGIVYRCRTFFLGKKMRFPITNIFSRELKDELSSFKPDLVHVHHPFWLGSRGRKLARKSGLPVVFTCHTRLDRLIHNIPLPGTALKEVFAHTLIRRFANRCDAVIAPSFSTEEYLRRLGVRPMIETIPTGINIKEYSLYTSGEVRGLRRRYATDGEKLLVSVCRLAAEKNVDFMIDGLLKVREKSNVPFKCVIVGDGPERPRLACMAAEAGMADNISFIGALEPKEVVKTYLASDLFVFASTTETQGMVLIEAMAGGCPVVAVNASGVNDVVENGINGFRVPENIDSWARSISLLLENEKLMSTLSKNSRKFAAEYSTDRIAGRVLMLYHRTLSQQCKMG